MFPTTKHRLTTPLVVALALLLSAAPAPAQSTRRHQRLADLQQQNALQAQQNAVQTAVQQTTAVLQAVNGGPPQVGMLGGVLQQGGTPNPINLQQQQNALQIAVQQTMALMQVSFGRDSALSQAALRQLNALQTALQQTQSLQSALSTQNGQLTAFQLNLLSQEQTNLMGLLTSQPPPLAGRMSRR
jgi:hypothetical protein